MKKFLMLGVIFVTLALTGYAQNAYLDFGLGVGITTSTTVNGANAMTSGSGLTEVGVELGAKAGLGPLAGQPLYIVAAASGMGHRYSDSSGGYIQFNSYLLGGGAIFYPIPALQLAVSLGYSFSAIDYNVVLPYTFYDTKGGFAWDVSAALDLGGGSTGWLVGARYYVSMNQFQTTNASYEQSQLSLFVRYAYRTR
jgi:hypothetical protein